MTDSPRHSIKVPRLFKTACKIAKLVREEGGSLKELVYNGKHPNIKALYALVVQTLQHEKDLDTILESSKILEKEKGLDPWLARVLITELTWGKKRLSGESKPVKAVLSYQSSYKIGNEGVVDAGNQLKDGDKVSLPRYVRVNTINMTMEKAIDYFRDEGWLLARLGEKPLFPSSDHFRADEHIPDMLVFPPGTEMYNHPLYRDRSILLQDKASCLAAHLLAPPHGSTVLDVCAAPGMKTTHLAARMGNKGTLYAVEKDPKRYKTLCNFVEESGATCVKTLLEDSVQLKAEDVAGVEYILVDPSCSGTGMVGRPKVGLALDDAVRLRKLVGFQRRLLLHALTSFPKAKRVVYSTCSLLPEENEGVVSWALNETAQGPNPSGWKLAVDPLCGWSNRGCEESFPGIGKHCLYSRPETDLTNGFFLAIFERKEDLCSQDSIRNQLVGMKAESLGTRKKKKKEEENNDEEPTVLTKEKKNKRKKKEKAKKEEERGEDGGEAFDGSSEAEVRGNEEEDDGRGASISVKKKKKGGEREEENAEMQVENGGASLTGRKKKKRRRDEEEGREEEEPLEGDGWGVTDAVVQKKKKSR